MSSVEGLLASLPGPSCFQRGWSELHQVRLEFSFTCLTCLDIWIYSWNCWLENTGKSANKQSQGIIHVYTTFIWITSTTVKQMVRQQKVSFQVKHGHRRLSRHSTSNCAQFAFTSWATQSQGGVTARNIPSYRGLNISMTKYFVWPYRPRNYLGMKKFWVQRHTGF